MCGVLCASFAAGAAQEMLLDDFEAAPQGWSYVGGQEFPGAKGSLARDVSVAHGGSASYRLQADFTGGGAYVGVWRDLATLAGRDVTEIRLWIKATHVTRFGVRINVTYRWEAEPMGRDYMVFVHLRSAEGKMVFQADHEPPVPTSRWSGRVEYENTVMVPPDLPLGEYKIVAGLWNPKGGAKLPVKAGEGVTSAGENAWQVGLLKVTADAPLPQLGPPTLNLDGYRLTFDEDFKDTELSVSAWGPGTRWIAHTPYAGDFGDARFADPTKDFPFDIHSAAM